MSISAEILSGRVLTLDELDRAINSPVALVGPSDTVRALSPLPNYVEHREDVNRVGRLSAEAVVREYEAAVREIETLGTELQTAAKKCEAVVAGVHDVVAEIKEIAASYRDQGTRHFLQIEAVSLMTTEVRDTCEMLKKKIAAET
jgi:hypothetical protein